MYVWGGIPLVIPVFPSGLRECVTLRKFPSPMLGAGSVDDEVEGLDDGASTCFLCQLTFKDSDLTIQHLHHVHMKWVKRTLRSSDNAPEVATQVRFTY